MAPSLSFCVGRGITMGSAGFAVSGVDPEGDCVMLWTDAFAVNSVGRAVLANLCVAFLALVSQYLASVHATKMNRAKEYAKLHRRALLAASSDPENGACTGYATSSISTSVQQVSTQQSCKHTKAVPDALPKVSNWEHLGDSLQHGLRIFIAYLLMLAAMTYDVALIASIVVGFMLGFYAFTKDTSKVPASADPCCCS
ncbi:hypothetical protein ATCC90586_001493 [Pythium insidiosum]|nr:hypothetical protein ATCC90586_001493 [Pythium insidiosum]